MATADEYAAWIVANPDKKGTPEFDTVAQAYQQAKGETTPAPAAPEPGLGTKLVGNAFQGLVQGGPLGMAQQAMSTLGSPSEKLLGKMAYEGGGRVTDAAVSMGLPAPVAAGAGLAANVGIQAAPAYLAGKGIGMMAAPTMEAGATRLMQSALKPTLADLKSGNAATAISTLLDEGINPTAGGVMKLKSKISALNDEIATAIKDSPATVDKQATGAALKDTLDRFSKQVSPSSDLASIRAAWNDFLNHPLFTGNTLSVQDAQALKQGTYRILDSKYGQLGTADTEAQKAIARGLKDEIAKAVPNISGLNAEESRLIKTLDVTERRALMDANKNPMGLSLLAKNPAAWAGFMADKSALFKSLVARMMNSGAERIPQAIGSIGAAGAQGLFGQPRSPLLNPQQEQQP